MIWLGTKTVSNSDMSKITFRADDDLVEELEALEISKSEAMREALRSYLGEDASAEREPAAATDLGAIDEVIRRRVDELVAERLRELERDREGTRTRDARERGPGEVTVTVSLEDEARDSDRRPRRRDSGRTARVDTLETGRDDDDHERERTRDDGRRPRQPPVDPSDAARGRDETEQVSDTRPSDADAERQCGQCGDAVDDDHVYCPNCGEKTSRRLFCECGDEIRSDWSFCPGCGRRTPAADVLGRDTPS